MALLSEFTPIQGIDLIMAPLRPEFSVVHGMIHFLGADSHQWPTEQVFKPECQDIRLQPDMCAFLPQPLLSLWADFSGKPGGLQMKLGEHRI